MAKKNSYHQSSAAEVAKLLAEKRAALRKARFNHSDTAAAKEARALRPEIARLLTALRAKH